MCLTIAKEVRHHLYSDSPRLAHPGSPPLPTDSTMPGAGQGEKSRVPVGEQYSMLLGE